jgi:putative membrane protein insertion efficiency factor
MSTLRKRLKRPGTYLLLLILMLVLASLDSLRAPERQITARLYIGAVHGYQHYGRPLSKKYIRCRYNPTCSEYSLEAVRKYGIRRGLVLTATRIISCTSAVPFGTLDPVP